MHTPEQITYIMQELGLDPNNSEIRKVIERLAKAKPNVPIDERFIAALREDIQAHANQYSYSKQNKLTNNFSSYMNKILASALVVMVALAAGGLWYIQQTDKPLFKTQESSEVGQLLSGKYGITGVGEESFGELDKVAIVEAGRGNSASLSSAQGSANPVGGGMGGDTARGIAEKMATPPAGQGGASILPYPNPVNYTFDYEGEDIAGLAETQGVMKRIKPSQSSGIVSRIISLLSFGLVDLTRFQDVKLQNFSFLEDRDYGYGINVDIQQGLVSIYQNWEKWPEQQYSCVENYCGIQPQIRAEDMPSNEEAIAIADRLLNDFSVSREGYGAPRVVDTWRDQYELAADQRSFYIPEQVQVIYPLQLEGKDVVDESGNLTGMYVMIDARTRRAVSIYDLATKQFERSEYAGETDAKRLVEIAERGGFRSYPYTIQNSKETSLKLDTPTVEIVKIWYSTDNYRSNNELYVPALVFPIKNWKETGYWRQSVTVPLVRDILNSDTPPPVMPLDQPVSSPKGGATSSGNASSSSNAVEPAPANR